MIYFCIPAFNEERTVGVVLWKLRQVMTEMQRDFQIIVVDDASTDATAEVLNPYARVLPLTLIRNEQQLGYAASMEIAIREAARRSPYPKRDALVTMQADFTEDPDCVPGLIKRFEAGADLVAGQPALDEGTPKALRRGRSFFRWLVRGREWAQMADPFCGLRAYRVLTMKRALEARGTGRLLTWEGGAANAELLIQTMPHSRRTDTIETTLHYKRLQRPSRFRFFAALPQVMGLRSGKSGHAASVALPETTIVVPGALAVELATGHGREETRRRSEPRKTRTSAPGRGERTGVTRRPAESGRERGPRPPRPARPPRAPQAPVIVSDDQPVVNAAEAQPEKRRRRSRRRSRKPSQRTDQAQLTLEPSNNGAPLEPSTNGPPLLEVVTDGSENVNAAGAPRKKSRRGRRGGRGRKRTPRVNLDGATDNNVDEAPAPLPMLPPDSQH